MRGVLLALLVACSSPEPERCTDARGCPRPDEVVREHLEPYRGDLLLELGDTAGALVVFQRHYDRVLAQYGDRAPELAPALDKLAAAKRAQGKLRDALRLHDRSLALRPGVGPSLVARAATKLEAGDIAGARRDLDEAARMPGSGVAAVRDELASAAGDREPPAPTVMRIPPLAPDEPLTVARSAALATRVSLLVSGGRTDEARQLAQELRTRLVPGRDPRIATAVASALLSVDDRAAATAVLAPIAAALPNEASRTALRVFVLLARASDTQAAAAARAAISLYQAMPELDRRDHDEMWAITRR